jgi:Flp pilus assembly pilin Flp
MTVHFRRFCRDERGQDLIEYGLLASLLLIVLIGAVDAVGVPLGEWWNNIAADIVEPR